MEELYFLARKNGNHLEKVADAFSELENTDQFENSEEFHSVLIALDDLAGRMRGLKSSNPDMGRVIQVAITDMEKLYAWWLAKAVCHR